MPSWVCIPLRSACCTVKWEPWNATRASTPSEWASETAHIWSDTTREALMLMRVVGLVNTSRGKFARLRAYGKAFYGHEAPLMNLLDVKNEERQLKLGE